MKYEQKLTYLGSNIECIDMPTNRSTILSKYANESIKIVGDSNVRYYRDKRGLIEHSVSTDGQGNVLTNTERVIKK